MDAQKYDGEVLIQHPADTWLSAGKEEIMSAPTRAPATKRFVLRLSPEIHDAVAHWASEQHRSMNQQIAYVLRRALSDDARHPNLQWTDIPGRHDPDRKGEEGDQKNVTQR